MSIKEKLLEAAEEKIREWEDFQQNCTIFSKQFADTLKDFAELDEVRFHMARELSDIGGDMPLPRAMIFQDGGWATVLVKFDAGHVTVKVPVETRVHAGQAEIRVFEFTEQFTWPVGDDQLPKLREFVERVCEAIVDDLRNDLEFYMQGKLKRSMKFS